MNKLKLVISAALIIVMGCVFQSCDDNDDPIESEVRYSTINRGGFFTANMGTLTFRIVNNYPYILPSEGLSNYVEAPMIAFLGQFNSLDEVAMPSGANWQKQCNIENNGGYVAKVKWFDATSREDKTGYILMFVEDLSEPDSDSRPGVFHNEINVAYRLLVY